MNRTAVGARRAAARLTARRTRRRFNVVVITLRGAWFARPVGRAQIGRERPVVPFVKEPVVTVGLAGVRP